MMHVVRLAFLPLLLILFSATLPQPVHAQEQQTDAIVGTWMTEEGKAHIKIFRRGEKFYGKIVWLKEPNYEDGKPKVDKENPEEKFRTRPILGLEILTGFEYDEDLEWDDGDIYDPKNGKTYSCTMTLNGNNKTLEVRGYIGFSFIGRSQTWTRVKK